MAENIRAAVVQLTSGPNRDDNLEKTEQWMNQALKQGAQVIALPENFSFIGCSERDKLEKAEDPLQSPTLQFLRQYAKQKEVWIIGGSIPFSTENRDKVSNSTLLINPQGSVVARYDKMHLFDVNLGKGQTFRESTTIQAGREPVLYQTPWGKLGLTVCYDVRFPELYRNLSQQGATIFSVPAAFTLSTGKDHWQLLLQARAVENFSYVLAPNQWGVHAGRQRTYGHSMIIEPWGSVIAQVPDGEGVTVAELDQSRITACRKRIPALNHRIL
ncbi:carbon-nitrogen hydrolase family protein [Magnetococcales bacterium HHB-1]